MPYEENPEGYPSMYTVRLNGAYRVVDIVTYNDALNHPTNSIAPNELLNSEQ